MSVPQPRESSPADGGHRLPAASHRTSAPGHRQGGGEDPTSLSILHSRNISFLQRTIGNRRAIDVLQRRLDTDAYHAAKWGAQTYKKYLPPGDPERTDLPGMVEEVEDVWKAGQKGQQQWRALAKAWVAEIFEKGHGDKGPVKSVYQSEEDKATGGYSFSQKVDHVPLIVIHAHMEKNHLPSVDIGATEMGPIHWKWEAWENKTAGQGGPIDPSQYRLLNIAAARDIYNADVIKPHSSSGLATALAPVCTTPQVADLLLGALVGRFDPPSLGLIESFLAGLKGKDVDKVRELLSIQEGTGGAESVTHKDITVRAMLLGSLGKGADVGKVTMMKGHIGALHELQLEVLKPLASTTGTIELRPLLGGLEIPVENQSITMPTLMQIREIFDRVMGAEVLYNSATAPLELVSAVRQARVLKPATTMTDVFSGFAQTGNQVIDKYQAADCVAMAERVKAELAKIGVGSYVIGSTGGNFLNEIPDPEKTGRARIRHEEARNYAVFSHASVIVPYREPGGAAKAIHLETGMGPSPEFYKQYDDLFTAQIALTRKKYDIDNPIVDTGLLQKKHIRCKWKMWFSDSADQTKKAFIDLAEGTVFVTGGGTDPLFAKSFAGLKINFKEVVANPTKTVTITVKDTDVAMSNIDSLTLFLQIIAKEFKLGDQFVENMLYLATHLTEYSEQILLAPINAVRETMEIKEQTVAKRNEIDKDRRAKYATETAQADLLLTEAGDFVKGGDKTQALAKYTLARDAYVDVLSKPMP